MQELAVPSARVLFEWRSLDHVKLTESYSKVAPAFDFFHVNSIDVDADGNLLVSARNTWTVYKIDRAHRQGDLAARRQEERLRDGAGHAVRLAARRPARRRRERDDALRQRRRPAGASRSRAGSRSSLDLGEEARDARPPVRPPAEDARPRASAASRRSRTATSSSAGAPSRTSPSTRPAGAVLLDAKLPHGGQNYRTLRFPWMRVPAERPRLAARSTAVRDAALRDAGTARPAFTPGRCSPGARPTSLTPRDAPRPGPGSRRGSTSRRAHRYAAVVALDAGGKPLGRSAAVAL